MTTAQPAFGDYQVHLQDVLDLGRREDVRPQAGPSSREGVAGRDRAGAPGGLVPRGERWRQAHPLYVARLGPDASVIGPPPGFGERTAGRA
jgi:hypothetical protein